MYAGSVVLDTLILMLILDNPWTYGSEPGNCSISARRMQYTIKSGNTATINCTVTSCQERPVLSWYKDNIRVEDGQKHNAAWTNNQLFVLTISSAHKNDSGHYNCGGKMGAQLLNGHSIEVIILDENEQSENATNTIEDDGVIEKNKQWIIYSLSVLGVLCLLTLSCTFLLYFARKLSEKNKTDDILQSEMKVFTMYADVQNPNDSTIHDSDEGCTGYQRHKSCLLQFQDGSADYDKDISCWKSTGMIPDAECDYSVLTIHQPLPETQQTLLYATLNHGEPFHHQRSEPSVENECIEYATIGMKK